ncbi:MAG: CDP-alcohol phosphatidyltransferase family protein [Chitinophagaceae bacterium]|nr:CDP-alcohol phosphatidyltransferase family protein [Chitinophagaceae bacterium]
MKQIPNLFTLLNLVFGCLAIVVTLQNGIIMQYNAEGNQLLEIPEKIAWASLYIGLAAVVDFLDGFVARLFKATSPMGKQLDSLADVVSFGVAPAMIIYQFLRMSLAREEDGLNASFFWLVPVFILAAASAWRLAKFNLDDSQAYGFKGVPTPAMGLLVAALPMIYWHNDSEIVANLLLNKWFLYGLVVVLSWLMVSNLPLMALKFKDYTLKNNLPKLILLIIAGVAVWLLHWIAVPVIFVAYIILSLLFKKQH